MLSVRARRLGVLAVAAVAGAVLAVPAAADTPPSSECVVDTPGAGAPAGDQPLKVCASFDKSAYRSSEAIKLTLRVTNLGSATATKVLLDRDGSEDGNYGVWGTAPDLFNVLGVSILPGHTFVGELDGYAYDRTVGGVTVDQSITQNGNAYGDPIDISAPVTAVVSDYGGVVYVDANGNGAPDPGEGVSGVPITLTGPFGGVQRVSETTGADGSFDFTNLPGGVYAISEQLPRDLVINWPADGSGRVLVDGSPADTGVAIPAAAPLSDTLKATAALDKTTYLVGDTANITFTLTNSGSTAINGVQAKCVHDDDPGKIWGTGQGWEVLGGPGIDIAAGQTVTVHETELVPAEAVQFGSVRIRVDCYFGPHAAQTSNGYPEATTAAMAGPPTGRFIYFTVRFVDDNPVGGLNITAVLADPATQDPMEQSLYVGDYDGQNEFNTIPDGTYALQLGPGWRAAPGQPVLLDTSTLTDGSTIDFHVLPVFPVAR